MATNYPEIHLGPLPVAKINAALGTDLEPGNVILSRQAHMHMARDHPDDYEACIQALPLAIAQPSFVGQAPVSRDNFEIVRRAARPDGKSVLVAVGLELDAEGLYRVKSSYLLEPEKVDSRRRKGRLFSVLP